MKTVHTFHYHRIVVRMYGGHVEEYLSPYNTVSNGEGTRCNHPTRLDTYGCGCSHDCAYCYAKAILDFRGNWHPDNPHVAKLSRIREIVSKMEAGSVVRLGGMTDCFQEAEQTHHVTRETIRMLNERGVHQLIVTKSDAVADCPTLDKRLSHIQISITSTSDEPNPFNEHAPLPSKRLRAVQSLSERGFDVCMRISPYVPDFIDIDALRATGCDKVLVEFLRVNGNIRKCLKDLDLSPYTLKLGGYRHLPLKRKREYLKPILENFGQVSVCEDVYSHWCVWQQEVNFNKQDCCNLEGV